MPAVVTTADVMRFKNLTWAAPVPSSYASFGSLHLVTKFRVLGDDGITSQCGAYTTEWIAEDEVARTRQCQECKRWLRRQLEIRRERADQYADQN